MPVQYIVNEEGEPVSVVVPVNEWKSMVERCRALEPERGDTEYLLGSPVMRERLKSSLGEQKRMSWEEVQDALDL
ncbi:MAG: hypothetical protein PWQ57_1218 [Desulfovibrionales bacterium]|nr:hypothetical protein [Desulfovibrionales bacterium]